MSARRAGGATVAYQGGPGANGERAIARYWNGAARALPVRSFGALAATVADGGVEFGVVPVWNSTIGPIEEACDALARVDGRVVQVGEVTIEVRHALLGVAGASVGALRAVGSHRAALAQCSRFLARHAHLAPVVAWDTAGAARELARLARAAAGPVPDARGEPDERGETPWYAAVGAHAAGSLAVIADASVAPRHGLAVLAEEIQDDAQNATRFAVVRTREARWCW